MADFRFAWNTGVTFEAWNDPAATVGGRDLPPRLNPQPEHEHTRAVGAVGVAVQFLAIVDGVDAPLDVDLDADLFQAQVVESPSAPPACIGNVGQSSAQRFTPAETGHYTFLLMRDNHGGIYAHVDVR